jgi:proteasome activator subunit 4
MLIPGRVVLSGEETKADFVDLLKAMVDSAFSERGWAWTGKLLEKSVSVLTSISYSEMRMLNKEDYASEGEAFYPRWAHT